MGEDDFNGLKVLAPQFKNLKVLNDFKVEGARKFRPLLEIL